MRERIRKETIKLCVVLVVASFLGFLTENIWVGALFGYFDNRGMFFPGLVGYGFAIVAEYLIFGVPSEPHLCGRELKFTTFEQKMMFYIFNTMFFVSVCEIVLGNLVEVLCGIEWWNYSNIPLHIGKYTSILTSFGFAVMITLFMNSVFPKLMSFAEKVEATGHGRVAVAVMLLLVFDFLYEGFYMMNNKALNEIWHVEISQIAFFRAF